MDRTIHNEPAGRASSRHHERGTSLAELLIAFAAATSLGAAAFVLAIASRGMYTNDVKRTAINQNLRAGMDLIAFDVRSAGARLPGDITRIGIQGGNTLVTRRNVLPVVLPLCRTLVSGSGEQKIEIATKKDPEPGCDPVPDSNGDEWPDNLEVWREYRLANGTVDRDKRTLRAYIYDPTNEVGEFFVYEKEDRKKYKIHRRGGSWTRTYEAGNGVRIYILEEREYRLRDRILERIDDGDTDTPISVIDLVQDFQVRVIFRDGSTAADYDLTDGWSELQAIEISLSGSSAFDGRELKRELVSRFLPRNVLE